MLLPVQAQQKSQILSDIRLTMQDFVADISNINEDKKYFKENLLALSQTYASDTYFMSNGVQQSSFLAWAEEYCTMHLMGLVVQHTIDILENSLQKVDANNNNDKRYQFDATLTRVWASGSQTNDNLTFIVVYNGRNNYVLLTEINGRLSSISEMSGEQLFSVASEQINKGNKTLGMSLLKQAVAKNHKPAINLLGRQHFLLRQYDESYKLLSKSDESSGESYYMLAWMYENGLGTPKDWWKALDYYEKAIKDKYILANGSYRKLEKKMIDNNMIYTGIVVNEQGQGINSASVNIQGTEGRYLTDFYGNFTIKGLKKGNMLVFSSMGYETKVLPWNSNIEKRVTLKRIAQKPAQIQTTAQTYTNGNNIVVRNTHGVCKGKVTDNRGNAINMAVVVIEGTDIKVFTDYWGNYTIDGLRQGDTIVFSNPGCQTQKRKWGGYNMNVTLPREGTIVQQAETNYTTVSKRSNTEQRGSYSAKGKVTDSKGNGINSALVNIVGTDVKVLTDFWGNYELKGLYLADEIMVTNYGYQSQKIRVNEYRFEVNRGTRVINITLLKEGETTNRTSSSQTTSTPKSNMVTRSTQNRTMYTYSGKLVGIVKDRYTQKGINCALVQIQGTDIKVLTDLNGEFTLKGLKDGDKIIITNIGYNPGSHTWYKPHQKNIWNIYIEKQ